MEVGEQQDYGEVFRALEEFERRAKELAVLARRATEAARSGLTSGALFPSVPGTAEPEG
jgi:hypothetical protein